MKIHDQPFKVRVWDTAGQERFGKITKQYAQILDAVMLVFDLTNVTSFDSTVMWYKQIKEIKDIPIVFSANKHDLNEERVIFHNDIEKMARYLNLK